MAQTANPAAWTYEVKKKSATEYQLIFHLDLKHGWHIWSLKPGGDGFQIVPLFSIDNNTNVQLKGEVKETKRVGDDGEWAYTTRYFIDGLEVTEDGFREVFKSDGAPQFADAIHGANPWVSDALGVHPKQIEEAKARNKKHGLNIDYTPDGRPICTDSGQRRLLCKIEGVRQKNSYYGY
jgi:hypothetical protein